MGSGSVREFATAALQVKLADLLQKVEAPGERLFKAFDIGKPRPLLDLTAGSCILDVLELM